MAAAGSGSQAFVISQSFLVIDTSELSAQRQASILEADCISHLNHHQQWACHSRSLIASECLSTPKNVFMGGMFLEVLMAIKAEGKR